MFALRNLLATGLLLLTSCSAVLAGDGQRHVALDGQSNFRDIGGYETTDGRQVKCGEVFRSRRLPGLSDADVDRIDALGVRTVVNMAAFYRLQGAYIDASLEEAIEKHGSMQAYTREGLGLTDDEIKELRDQLLISPSS